jgi:dTDP-4-dehydrorhamnose 3,5-epimerase
VPADLTAPPPLQVEPTALAGVKLLRPQAYADARGSFFEAWHRPRFARLGLSADFVQDNVVGSRHQVLRGLHFQYPRAQLKLVSVLHGEVFDVVVDIRRGSATYGQWHGWNLSAENHLQLWIEPGFAHGYQVLSEYAVVNYKCTHVYEPADDRTVNWADPLIGINWPLPNPILSAKDQAARNLAEFPDHELFSS